MRSLWSSERDRLQSYCAPVISNGSVCTQIDFGGAQPQEVRYVNHGAAGVNQQMIPGIFRAGRRRSDPLRKLIPLGHFEEKIIPDGTLSENPISSEQVLDLESAWIECRNYFSGNVCVGTAAFVHKNRPVLAVRKSFHGNSPRRYVFHYFFAEPGMEHAPVKWCEYKAVRKRSGQEIELRYCTEGTRLYHGKIAIQTSGKGTPHISGNDLFFTFENPEGVIDFLILFSDSLDGGDWEKQHAALQKIAKDSGFDGLLETHRSEWKKFWNGFELDFPDSRMKEVFCTALYFLECSSTEWGIPVGIHPYSWNGLYFGFNHFTSVFFATGHPYEAFKISRFRRSVLDKAIQRTTNWNHSAGARFPWQSDEEGFFECASPGIWNDHIFHMGHIALEAWEYFRYSRDPDWLRETGYPIIRNCAVFFMRQAVYRLEGGRVVIGKCCDLERLGPARENAFLTTCAAIGAMEWAASAASFLQTDAAEAAEWRETASELRKSLPCDGEKYIPFPGCGETSIAVAGGLYPYNTIPPSDPFQKKALDDYRRHTSESGNMYPHGRNICSWYASWLAAALIRAGDEKAGLEFLHRAAASAGAFSVIYEINEPGIFVSHPWCSAPSACYIQAILELFLRTEGDTLLAASLLPETWKDYRFRLNAPDDLSVYLNVSDGTLRKLTVKAGSNYSGTIRNLAFSGKKMPMNLHPGSAFEYPCD